MLNQAKKLGPGEYDISLAQIKKRSSSCNFHQDTLPKLDPQTQLMRVFEGTSATIKNVRYVQESRTLDERK